MFGPTNLAFFFFKMNSVNLSAIIKEVQFLRYKVDMLSAFMRGMDNIGTDNGGNRIIQKIDGFSTLENRKSQTSALFTDDYKFITYDGKMCANLFSGIEFRASSDDATTIGITPYWDDGTIFANNDNMICNCLSHIDSINADVVSTFGFPYIMTNGAPVINTRIGSDGSMNEKVIYIINLPAFLERFIDNLTLFPGVIFHGIMPFISFVGSCYSDKPDEGERVVKLVFDIDVENLVSHYVINKDPAFGVADSSTVTIPTSFIYGRDINVATGLPTETPSGQTPYIGTISLNKNVLTLTMSSTDSALTGG